MSDVFSFGVQSERTDFDIYLKHVNEQLEMDKDFQFNMEIEDWEYRDVESTCCNGNKPGKITRYASIEDIKNGDNFDKWGTV